DNKQTCAIDETAHRNAHWLELEGTQGDLEAFISVEDLLCEEQTRREQFFWNLFTAG
ncbi:hypothetical protein ACJX0J_038969, partial [Zea mays]